MYLLNELQNSEKLWQKTMTIFSVFVKTKWPLKERLNAEARRRNVFIMRELWLFFIFVN